MNARYAMAVIVAVTLLTSCGGAEVPTSLGGPGGPAAVHGWIIGKADRAYISDMLALAPDYGVTQVQLSTPLIWDIEDISLKPDTAALVRSIAEEAESHGLDLLVWAHEFTEGTGSVCFDESAPIWDQRREHYRKAFELIPELDGIVLMFGSAAPDPWFAPCACDDPEIHARACADPSGQPAGPVFMLPRPAERVRMIIEAVADVTEALDRQLLVRTFIHSPWELDWVGEGLRLAGDRAFTVMSKPVPQDFQPYYPHNPLIGSVAAHPQVTEFDLTGEYWGQSTILNPQVEYMTYRFRYLREQQGVGTVNRVDYYSRHVVGTPSEINVFAASSLMADASIHPDAVYDAWLEERYGLASGSAESEAFRRVHQLSWDAARKRHYVLGFWALDKGSFLPDDLETRSLAYRSSTKYAPGLDALFGALSSPSERTLRLIFQEGWEAVLAAREAERLFDGVRDALSGEDAADWTRRLRLQTLECEAWLWGEEILWGVKLYRRSRDPEHRAWLEHAVAQISSVREEILSQVGVDSLETPAQIAGMVATFRAEYPEDVVRAEKRKGFTIELPVIEEVSASGARIRVEVDQPARCALHWGTTIPYTPVVLPGDSEPHSQHIFSLTGLSADMFYLFRPVCQVGEEELQGGDWYLWTAPAPGRG